ncbi:MAG: SRPBCC family protein [Armatimonadota bacterium]|nr:SRPBCC family protein [Armatimonadota bacterium]MCX7776800.1 SRPBCC family protein [Armatimonadota bacterium]MDW8024596.1 SRPBCC family protein [Armatimonadota bacterium]
MPTVICEKFVKAPPEVVFNTARDVERYVIFMGNVESIKVLSDDGVVRITEWVVNVPVLGRRLRWLERDVWDSSLLSCSFEMVEGDMDSYSGEWRFERSEDGTLMRLTISYEYDIPLVGQLLRKIIERLVEANANSILDAVKNASEGIQSYAS